MRPNPHHELAEGLKLTAVAVMSAVLTAALVIGAGRAVLHTPTAVAVAEPVQLIRVVDR